MPHAAIRSIMMRTENCLLDIVMWRVGREGKKRPLPWGILLGKGAEKWVSYWRRIRLHDINKLIFS